MHIPFSQATYVFARALGLLTEAQRDTVIAIAYGGTHIIEPGLAHEVYNIIGDLDWPSLRCNGGMGVVEREREQNRVRLIEQKETQPWVGGHYNAQPDYQDQLKLIIETQIKGVYEIY